MSQKAASMKAPLARRAPEWNSITYWSTLAKASATQWYSGGSLSQSQPLTRGTTSSPLFAMS